MKAKAMAMARERAKRGGAKAVRAITQAQAPFRIVHVSPRWCGLCGFDAVDAVGSTFRLIQGPETDKPAIRVAVARLLATGSPAKVRLTNYRCGGEEFVTDVTMDVVRDGAGEVAFLAGWSKPV